MRANLDTQPLAGAQQPSAASAPATAAPSSCMLPLAQAADFDDGAPKKYVAGMVAGRIVRVAASGADSIDEVQTLSTRLPNGDLRSWQVPRGTPIQSIAEEFEKELPPYHEAKLFVRDEILCGTIADEVEGEVTLVRMPSITKALAALERLHGLGSHFRFLPQPPCTSSLSTRGPLKKLMRKLSSRPFTTCMWMIGGLTRAVQMALD